jgi:hypothetical protein
LARRKKPHDPAAAIIAAQERAARDAEVARLKGQGAEVTIDRGGRILSARRSNVFNLLLKRNTITQNHYNAAYTLALDWSAWKGLDGKPESFGEVVDGGGGSAELVTDRMIRAGREVARTLAGLEPADQRLMVVFMVATVEEDRPMSWRGLVQATLGETRRDHQTRAVVGALEALRVVYEGPRRAAA